MVGRVANWSDSRLVVAPLYMQRRAGSGHIGDRRVGGGRWLSPIRRSMPPDLGRIRVYPGCVLAGYARSQSPEMGTRWKGRWLSKGDTMTNTTPTQEVRNDDTKESKNISKQSQESQSSSRSLPTQQTDAGSSDRHNSPGRKPLFGT